MQYHFRECSLDAEAYTFWRQGEVIALEPKVFQVLLYLLQHRDRVVSRDELLEHCWPGTFVSDWALTRCLARIRKAVGDSREGGPMIQTVHGRGYRFAAPVSELAQVPSPAPVDSAPPHDSALGQVSTPVVAPLMPGPSAPAAPQPSAPLPAPVVRHTSSEAERRQLTVLCCDLVDATTLAGRLDPEDLREVLGQYHATCTAVIARYGGAIAQALGERLLVYFGWPQAHEDDARRAVHAGLALVMAVRDLSHGLGQDAGQHLALRIGIHTGLVVVGAGEEDTPSRQLAVGATPNVAAQMQALAAPGTVVISDATYHLVQGYFGCQPLGEHTLLGMTAPTALYHVQGATGAQGRLDLAPPQQRTLFVGREAELAVLRERAALVRQGVGQVVLLSGEAGIGKSRLVQVLHTELATDGFTTIACRCSPYYQYTALHPVIEWLEYSVACDSDTPGAERMARLEVLVQQARLDRHESVPLLASLLHLDLPEGRYPALSLTPQRQRQRTLETLVALVLACSAQQPVLLMAEDLHWSDPTTLEWLGMVVDQGPTAPLFTIMTCRPMFVSPWSGRAHVTLLSVSRLASRYVTQMAQWLGGDQLSAAQLRHIVAQTDGVPLFVEEVTKFVLAAHRLQGLPGGPAPTHTVPEVPIPVTLRDALMARLDQLGPAKGTAQLGATIGREFSYALLQAVAHLEEDIVSQDLQQLVEAELLYQRGVGAAAVYVFKHTLIQEAAYASLLRKTRQHYHQHIAQVLEAQFPDSVATQPELLAHHYTEAGLHVHAIPYWQRAGQRAIAHSAHAEVIGHLTKGLALLKTLPETPEHTKQELEFLTTLGPTLIATKGHASPEVAHVYTRAHALCQQAGDSLQRLLTLNGLRRWSMARADHRTAYAVAEQLLTLATQYQEPGWLLEANLALGESLFSWGEFVAARTALEQGIALYNPEQHLRTPALYSRDTAVNCHAAFARLLWLLGYPAQALQWGQKAVTLAQDLSHPFSQTFALFHLAGLHQIRRETHATQQHVEASLALCAEYGLEFFRARGIIVHGWTRVIHGEGEQGIVQIRQGLAAYQATGAEIFRPYYAFLLAEAYGTVGDPAAGLAVLEEVLASIERTQERWWAAEIHRCKGELLLQAGQRHQGKSQRHTWLEAQQSFCQALDIARQQQAKSLELRAAVSLSRLWHQQGQRAQARQLLSEVYGWFTEGFDTADLQEAKALLAALS